jgi:hypothetical protein
MEDADDFGLVDHPSAPAAFAADSLRPVHHLNRRLLEILIEESRRRVGASAVALLLGRELAALGIEVRTRLATVPISLVDGGFKRDDWWRTISSGEPSTLSELVLPRTRTLELAPLTFGAAAAIARISPESARLIFGMTVTVAQAFAEFPIDVVQRLGQTQAHLICPRWHHRPEIWRALIATAQRAEDARLPPVGVRAMNQLLADLEACNTRSERKSSTPPLG